MRRPLFFSKNSKQTTPRHEDVHVASGAKAHQPKPKKNSGRAYEGRRSGLSKHSTTQGVTTCSSCLLPSV